MRTASSRTRSRKAASRTSRTASGKTRRSRVELSAPPPGRLTLGSILSFCLAPAKAAADLAGDMDPWRDFRYERSAIPIAEFEKTMLLSIAAASGILGLAAGAATWGVLKSVALVLARLQRPKYYPQERLRRQALARERRRIRRRTTLNPMPTPEAFREAWSHVRESPAAMIRFGSVLCDLEAYVDNSLIHDESGEIVGRNPGIRGWIRVNCPELFPKYTNIMSYKAMANKFRQAMGIEDPYPADRAVDLAEDDADGGNAGKTGGRRKSKNTVRKDKTGSVEERGSGMAKEVRRLLADCEALGRRGFSRRSVGLAIDLRVHPDKIPRELEIAERRRQGLADRDGIARRLVQRMA